MRTKNKYKNPFIMFATGLALSLLGLLIISSGWENLSASSIMFGSVIIFFGFGFTLMGFMTIISKFLG